VCFAEDVGSTPTASTIFAKESANSGFAATKPWQLYFGNARSAMKRSFVAKTVSAFIIMR